MPKARIRMKVISAAKGSTMATVSAARTLPKKSPSSTMTSTVASIRAVATAFTALDTSEARS